MALAELGELDEARRVIELDRQLAREQGSIETVAFSQESFDQLMALAKKGIGELVALQKLTVS